ncbi:MAG: hypothetical protein AB1649_06460 [Chloroflexota bacterium]
MPLDDGTIRWARKVPQNKIRRLYETDAQGIIDTELIDDVGWALWERCDSILIVTSAHYGHVRCPVCSTDIDCPNRWSDGEIISCVTCGWQMPWASYHQSYRGKQLFGANAVDIFKAYHEAFPQAKSANAKMLLIDQLIHAFHVTLTEIGRPVAANLIEGSLGDVIRFLDGLTSGNVSATGITNSRAEWRSTLMSAPWSQVFMQGKEDSGTDDKSK